MSFVHLHNHSHYSILEGLPKPIEYIKKAKEFGMNAVTITDSSNLHGCHEFYKACKSEGINPILGTEILVESSLDEKLNHKLVLLAKSLKGYRNIISLTSKASLENPGKIPKITLEDIKNLIPIPKGTGAKAKTLDIICLSGPISGEIPFYILSGQNDEKIISRIEEYQNIFGKENYFLELIYHEDIPKQKLVTDKLIEINKNFNIPVVATNNCYYINKEDKQTQDIIQALGTGHEIENPDRKTLINGDYSFFSEEEMQMLFGFIPEALENTVLIADMINIEIETGNILIPTFELPEEHQKIFKKVIVLEKNNKKIKKLDSSEWYLRYLSFKGLNFRFNYKLSQEEIFSLIQKLDKPSLNKALTDTSPDELKSLSLTYYSEEKKEFLKSLKQNKQDYIERLEYELVVIHEMGFDAYFLIVADYINWARDNNIPVGPGRGSAAGSVMAYLSGITDLDPIKYGLLFERFLNPARVSMPDIDTDFADNERDRVIEYCGLKYGFDKVARVSTFGTFAARAAVKDVGRVMGIAFQEMNELVKLIPEKPGTKLKDALEDSLEFKETYNSNKKYKHIIDNALKIEGNVRQLGVHACAVIIAPEPITNFTALGHPPKDETIIVTQYNAHPLEDLGLLKMDFLGLKNLTIIKRAIKIIKNNKKINIDILNINMIDKKTFEIFAAGDTTGIFQFESDGMRKYLRDLAPNSFEDLIAMVSLYRPGPIAYIPTYIDRKYGREDIKYLTYDLEKILEKRKYTKKEILEEKRKLEEDLKGILDVSYGIAVYQEQLMFIVQYMAGFSLGEADLLRRGVGKKKIDVIEALKKEFITKSASFKGYKPETSKYIYEEMIQPAANYSFNKSHAACYAFIAYQTAYLKAYYPTEFLCSVMISDEENMEKIVMEVAECEEKGISILPPSVEESMKHFTYIDDKNIRFGLKAIKGIGEGPISKIIEIRNKGFKSLENFIERCGKEVINKKSLEALILSGAMDKFGDRKQMIISIGEIIRFCKKDEKKNKANQIGLFDNSSLFKENLELIETNKFSFEETLKGEKEVIGFCVSGHPLDGLQRYCNKRSNNIKKLKISMDELREIEDKKPSSKEKNTRNNEEICQAIGVILDIRKIITKTGKNMMFLKCEGFDYDFEVVIFPKDIEKYLDKLEVYKIIIVNGNLDINFKYSRKSIRARDIKIASISMIHNQAKDLELFDNKKRFTNKSLNEIEEKLITTDNKEKFKSFSIKGEKIKNENNFEESLEKKINKHKTIKYKQIMDEEFIIKIPVNAKKEDLIELKTFLLKQESGFMKIYIDLKGQKIYTKISLLKLDLLNNWIENKWKL